MSTPPTSDRDSPLLLSGRYELGATLGRGGMADVYRALDRVLDREVAVKVLREGTAEESDRARFIAEARTLAGLSHSGLVTVLDAGFGPEARTAVPPGSRPVDVLDHPYLVMELVEGPTLAHALAEGPLPDAEVGSIGGQVAQALAYVHAHDVVHRDVKPGNVLLGSAHRVKLADFGIARLLADTARHTRTGHAIGTAAYLAPEQVTGRPVSGSTDVYSLGLVLLEALTGELEYPGPPTEAALARLHRPPRVPGRVPEPWRQLLVEMTAMEPASRPSAAQVAERLLDDSAGPVLTHDPADAVTAPLLATESRTDAAGVEPPPGETRVLTSLAQPAGPTGSPLGRRTSLTDRLRALTPSQRGIVAAIALLVLVLAVAALVGRGDTGSSDIPDNTPTELREPLQRLHDAVDGDTG